MKFNRNGTTEKSVSMAAAFIMPMQLKQAQAMTMGTPDHREGTL
jgi:hypothetical protein